MAMKTHMLAYGAAAILIIIAIILMAVKPKDDADGKKKKQMKIAGYVLLVVGILAGAGGAYMHQKGKSAGLFSAYMSDEF